METTSAALPVFSCSNANPSLANRKGPALQRKVLSMVLLRQTIHRYYIQNVGKDDGELEYITYVGDPQVWLLSGYPHVSLLMISCFGTVDC